MSFIEVVGVVSSMLGIFSFLQDNFQTQEKGVAFKFAVGLDGSGPSAHPLKNAGGNLPDIRVFNEHGDLLGKTLNHRHKCGNGHTDCESIVKDVHQQPTYTLFSGNNDAICLAWATVTFPEGTKYAWVGNWGQQCGAPWYYSDIFVQNDKGADKVTCTWLDGDGDIETTAMQVHWPEYHNGFEGNGNNPSYYCNHPPVLKFYTTPGRTDVIRWAKKRNMFANLPSFDMSPREDSLVEQRKHTVSRLQARLSTGSHLIKSNASSHLATELCKSHNSVGPSFVSYEERMFCHMADKKLYPFCADIKQGECWEDGKQAIVEKSASGIVRRADNPAVAFTYTTYWGNN